MEENSDHFFQHVALVSIFTTASRVLGLVRDMACAALFGGGMVWDAFSFAFRIPNLFRRLFGEGALSVASLPVFTDYLENRGREEAVELMRIVATVILLLLFAVLLLGVAFFVGLPLLTGMSERWRLVFALSAVLLPYMLFVCLSALAGSILHSLRRFAVPAASPLLLNGCWIIAVLLIAPLLSNNRQEQIFVVAAGILVAGVFQLGMHLIALQREGITYRPVLGLRHPAVRRIFAAMAPVTLGMAAYQINVLLDGVIAISLAAPEGRETFSLFGRTVVYPMQVGANSALYFADRLMQFPLGIFGISLATAIFPVFSSCAAKRDWKSFSHALTDGLGAVLFIAIPAGAGLMLVGRPAITLLFQRGEFTAAMSSRTYMVLIAHSAGLWAYCGRHVLERAFFACNDQLTPVKIASGTVALNAGLNLSLIWLFAEAGLALATAISATFQVIVLFHILVQKTASPQGARLLRTFVKTVVATLLMSSTCLILLHYLPLELAGSRTAGAALRVAATALTGTLVYLAAGKALRIPEFGIVSGMLFRKKIHG